MPAWGIWIVVVTAGNIALRAAMPGYAEAEAPIRAMEPGGTATHAPTTFTLAMLLVRLVLGAVSSVAAGATTAWIARGSPRPPWIAGIVLVALFIPVHVWLWNMFPLWYHVIFLVSLLPCALFGAALVPTARR